MTPAQDGPRVSAVIPTRERPERLARALAAALAQEDADLEVIVVDDASAEPERTRAVVDAAGDARARFVERDAQGGPGAARNSGIAEATGEWIAFLDDDDSWAPGKLAAQIAAMAASGAGWGWCATAVVKDDGSLIYEQDSPDPRQIGSLLLLRNAVPGSASSAIARRELLDSAGGFDEELSHLADWDLWLRLSALSPAAGVEDVLATQRIHPGGMHAADTRSAVEEFGLLRDRHPGLESREFSRWVAGNHWRAGRRGSALAELGFGRFRYR